MTVMGYHPGSVQRAKEIGTESVMVGLRWSEIEPIRTDPPTYNWSGADRNISLAVQNGFEPFLLFTGNPDWAQAGDCKILTEPGRAGLTQMVSAAAARYQGQVRLWSFYNEPDCNGPTAPPWGFSSSSCYGDFRAEYTAVLQAVHPMLKAADPDNLVAFGGLAFEDWAPHDRFSRAFLDEVLRSSGANYFDLMNFHHYTDYAGAWEPFGRDVIGKTAYIQAVLSSHGVSKPIILTEIGKAGLSDGDDAQVDYAIQGMTRAFAAGNDLVIWYELFDNPQDPGYRWVLVNSDSSAKPGVTAYQLLAERLRGFTSSACPETGYTGAEAYSFRSGDGTREELVAWATGGERTIQVPAARVVRSARTGQATVLRDGDDGQADGLVAVMVGASPVILNITTQQAASLASGLARFKVFLPTIGRGLCR